MPLPYYNGMSQAMAADNDSGRQFIKTGGG